MALDLAVKEGGVIVNTDSMQVYSVLDILTARPAQADIRRVPHRLYGHVSPTISYSTGAWLRDVIKLMEEGVFSGKAPIFVGGTGLYFRALTEGIAEMPDIPAQIRERWRRRLTQDGPDRLHHVLARKDPEAALRLKPGDGQRIARALEVLEASGKSILRWQAEKSRPLIDMPSAHFFVIEPERKVLVERIDRRFDAMLEAGAMEEVRAMTALELDPALPAMKAIGLRELQAADSGEISLSEAVMRAKTATRQYSKRQATWFRNQLGPEWTRITGLP